MEDQSVVLFYERFPSRRQLLSEGTLNPEVCPVHSCRYLVYFLDENYTTPLFDMKVFARQHVSPFHIHQRYALFDGINRPHNYRTARLQ